MGAGPAGAGSLFRPIVALATLALLACQSGGRVPWGDPPDIPTDDDDDDDTDDGGDDDTGEEGELEHIPGAEGEPEDPAGWIFTLDQVPEVEITLSTEAYYSLWEEPYTWVEASLVFGDQSLEQVGVRLKGKVGSFRNLNAKAGFKLDFNRFVTGQTLYGLERLNLDNMVQDVSSNHDRVAYRLYNGVGVAAPRVGYATVRVDGDAFGLYALIEDYDDVFMERAFEDPSGNLYDGDYIWYDDGSWDLADFIQGWDEFFQLDEGVDVGLADVQAVTEALASSCETPAFMDTVGAVLDLEQFALYWAVESWIGQFDGYSFNRNNNRVYFDPADGGRAHMHPWDHDNAFYEGDYVTSPLGRLARCCDSDEACHQLYEDALSHVSQTAVDIGLLAEMDEAVDLINPYLEDDPRLEWTVEDARSSQRDVVDWLETRDEVLASYSE